jgi:hypothetical protein
MQPTNRAARLAGFAYLLLLPAPFSLMYVPNTLVVRGDAATTAGRILAHETLFQAGIFGELFLYRLLSVSILSVFFCSRSPFPFGFLVMRSGFLPRVLGVLLIVNGFAYVAVSLTSLFAPDYARMVSRATLPALLGELWIMLWLLFKGVTVQRLAAPAV